MAFSLDNVVPWGRSFDEYRAMFALTNEDLQQKILGCGDGLACFNAELTRRSGRVVSVDPLYYFSAAEISQRIDATFETVIEQTRRNQSEFVWEQIRSPDELAEIRSAAMQEFLTDYAAGKREGRYRTASLPTLPFDDGAFDIAVCSHFLFLYSAHFSAEFHVASIRELCRVAREVRIFPLLELGAIRSRHREPVMAELSAAGYDVQIRRVPYEFQKQGNEMLVVSVS
ncbi:MAG: SAM-dependent methyltransferase [Gimesia sp.]|nr:SAM-dependent methyltransferase [Gimesia sp.]|tara:strand:+ start:31531 stop:32214 length:684 start_codon:yes stop_codon:yes gene_type:complete